MLRRRLRSCAIVGVFVVFASLSCSQLSAQDSDFAITNTASADTTNLDIQADFTDYDKNLGVAKATGDVVVKYGDVEIKADQIEFNQSSGNIFARDNVRVYRNGQVIDAEEVIYNIETGEMTTSRFKSALEPILVMSDNIQRPEEGSDGPITLLDATFTTHDSANPDHRVFVKKLEVYPDDKIVMHGAKLYSGDRQLFWFPYYVQPMNEELGYYFIPGWNSAWGGYLLNRYGFMVNDDILAKAHFDARSERGLAGGLEFEFQKFRDNDDIGRLNLYYAQDNNPQMRFNGRNRKRGVTSSRHRINFQHRIYFPGSDDETFYLDFDINRLSDQFVYEDFFPSEFRIDPRPDNLINLNKLFPQGEVSLTGRYHINEFFQTDTRSPELAVDIIRTPIADSGFYYQGLTTYGILDEEYSTDRLLRGAMEPSGFNRFQTYHEVLHPLKVGNVLNVVPRVGGGYAHYNDFEIPGLNTFESSTTHAGVDLSFKMSKRSPHIHNKALGLDGLLHVVRPYVNYSYINTDEINGRFTPIDRFTPTTRLRAIDMPLFTSMDDLRDWSVFRTGVSQSFITKRNGRSYEWLALNNYIDIYDNDPEYNRDTSNFFTEVDWRPLPWLRAKTTAQVPLFDDTLDFTEVSSSLQFMPTDWFHFSVGHYYLTDHPFFQNSSLYSLNTYTRLGDEWGLSTSHRFESDDNTLEYQQYSIHKDFASWTASLGGIVRDNRRGENEYGVLFSLTLKAFPKMSLPVDFQPGGLGAED